MTSAGVWNKLNLGTQTDIVVLKAPDSFGSQLRLLKGIKVRSSLSGVRDAGFVLAFVTKQKEVDSFARSVAAAAPGDAVVWFAYPKASSKRYTSDIRRDGWQPIGDQGFEGVRMVAIDDDWTAVRFRRVEFIKTLSRSKERTMSPRGKARST